MCRPRDSWSSSIFFKSLTIEFQSPAVFGHRPHELVGGTVRESRLDFNCYADLGAHLARKMRDHFVGDATGVAPDAGRI